MHASLLAAACTLGCVAGALPALAADEITQEQLLNADDEPGNWLLHHKNFAARCFASLKEINRGTVKNLEDRP